MMESHHHSDTQVEPHGQANGSPGSHSGHAPSTPHAAHDKHEGHDPEAFRQRFWLCLILTIPVVLFSELVQDWFGYSLGEIPGHDWVSPVLGTFVFVYGGRVFLVGGWREVLDRQPGMMLLISLAITVAFVASVASALGILDLE